MTAELRGLKQFNIYWKKSTGKGFEPSQGDRIGLAVQRLNHSATLSHLQSLQICLTTILHHL